MANNFGIEWYYTREEVGEDVVRHIENELGIQFPQDYIDVAKKYNGGYPSLDIYDFEGKDGAVLSRLLSYHSDDPSYIVDTYRFIRDRLVDGVYPFAEDAFGNHICFDYRSEKENPAVVFWDHELAFVNSEKGIFPICSSFTELLSKLYTE